MIIFLSSLFSLPKKSWNIRIRKISPSAFQPHLCPPSHTRVSREHIWHWCSWQVGHRDVFGKELDEDFFVLSCPRPCKSPLTSKIGELVEELFKSPRLLWFNLEDQGKDQELGLSLPHWIYLIPFCRRKFDRYNQKNVNQRMSITTWKSSRTSRKSLEALTTMMMMETFVCQDSFLIIRFLDTHSQSP